MVVAAVVVLAGSSSDIDDVHVAEACDHGRSIVISAHVYDLI